MSQDPQTTRTTSPATDASTADLVKQLTTQSQQLVRMEVELAKAELTAKGKQAGIGAGLFGGAGVFGFYAFGALIATIILLLSTAIEPWLSALIVTVVLAVIAAVLALTGKNKVQQAVPPAPQQAIDTTKADVAEVKQRASNGRSGS